MAYGYNPAEYRQNFDFIANAGQQIGSGIDTAIAENKKNKELQKIDSDNAILYREMKTHLSSLPPDIKSKLGIDESLIKPPVPGQKDYSTWATTYAQDIMSKAAKENLVQQLIDTSKSFNADVGNVESGETQKSIQNAEQQGWQTGNLQSESRNQRFGIPEIPQPGYLETKISPQTKTDLTVPPENIPVTGREVSATEYSDAAKSRGIPLTEQDLKPRIEREQNQRAERVASATNETNKLKIEEAAKAAANREAGLKEYRAAKLELDKQKNDIKKQEVSSKNSSDYAKLKLGYAKLRDASIKNKTRLENLLTTAMSEQEKYDLRKEIETLDSDIADWDSKLEGLPQGSNLTPSKTTPSSASGANNSNTQQTITGAKGVYVIPSKRKPLTSNQRQGLDNAANVAKRSGVLGIMNGYQ